MNKLLLLITALLSLSLQTFSQVTPTWAWGTDYAGTVVSSIYHDDYVYVIGNYSNNPLQIGSISLSNGGGDDMYLAKWDTLGNLIWAKSISDTANQTGVAIHVNSNNEIVIGGNNANPSLVIGNDTITSGTNNGAFIVRYDVNGNVLDAFGILSNHLTDFCIDNSNNIYAGSYTGVFKYSSNGIFIWQFGVSNVSQIVFSSLGSCIMVMGSFVGNMTLGGTTITEAYSTAYSLHSDLYCFQADLNGNVNWLINVTESVRLDWGPHSLLQESTGDLFIPSMHYSLPGVKASIFKISLNGLSNLIPFDNCNPGVILPNSIDQSYPEIMNISGKDSILSFMIRSSPLSGISRALGVFNLNTQKTILSYQCNSDYHLYEGPNSIYMSGLIGSVNHKFGKLGYFLLYSPDSYLINHYCIGTTNNLTSNIIGGTPPLTYSWMPSTGLSSTTNSVVSFIPTAPISYTLTVTDSTGNMMIDTFNVIIDTPLSPITITPQSPTFCHDSMYLYSNATLGCEWHKFNGSLWLPIYYYTNLKIIEPGLYRIIKQNECNLVGDTILINPTVLQPTIIQNNYTLTCTNTSNVNYQWYFNGTAIGTNDSILTITQDGQYIVKITDSAGCIGFDTLTVIGLGIQGISSNENISIYPNPSSELIHIEVELNESSPLDLKLFDAQGRVVWLIKYEEKTSGKYNEHINLKSLGLKPGVYLLTGRTLSNQWTKRIVYLDK